MKSRATFLLSFAAIITLTAVSAFAAYSGGTGEPNSPYQIATKADLLALAADTNDYGKCFIMTADVNMAGQVFTTAIIASGSNPAFTGTFDGNGHKIANFIINGGKNAYIGLFGQIGSGYNSSGSIENLGVENCSVSGDSNSAWVGGLVAYNYGGSISNCYSTGTVSCGSKPGIVGGLVGYNYRGSISNCHSTCAVSSEYQYNSREGGGCVGGLVGDNFELGSVSKCYSTGVVSGYFMVGGLVGYEYGAWDSGFISNCYSTGAVSSGSNSEFVGGLVGYSGNATFTVNIDNCYSTGAVSSGSNSEFVGGLLGYIDYSGSISKCFWDTETSNQTTSDGGTGEPTVQMQTISTFTSAGWNFTTNQTIGTWRMCVDGINYPLLSWQFNAADFVCPDGVGMEDLNYFVQQWLETNCTSSNNYCGGADMNASGKVDFLDFSIFAQNWLSGQ